MKSAAGVLLLSALTDCTATYAAAHPPSGISIPSQDLVGALNRLSSLSGTSLLYDPSLAAGKRAHRIRNCPTVEDALTRLLLGTSLTFRRVSNTAIVLSRAPAASTEPTSSGAHPESAAVPEILVVGKRALNLDIPRSPDDIQPYQITAARDVAQSGAQAIDEFLKTRLSANATSLSTIQAPVENQAGTQSQIDLRGLGSEQTLVLVDGHRLPGFPTAGAFLQSNVNGIPVSAIDRIETLASTAGGIYGPGATGGVVNLVLKHDPEAVSLGITRGISARGDAPNWRIDAHWGFESADGSTRFSMTYSHYQIDGIAQGDRDYVEAARATRYANDPRTLNPPSSTSVNLKNFFNQSLVLKPQYGGQSLGSAFSSLPVSAIGGSTMASLLLGNAGHYDLGLSPDGEGTKQSLLTSMRNDGADLSLRQKITNSIEAYVDVLGFRTVGSATGTLRDENNFGLGFLTPGDPANPFQNFIVYSYPEPGIEGRLVNRTQTYRATAGLIIGLAHHWRADIDISKARTSVKASYPSGNVLDDYPVAPLDIFADPTAFGAVLVKAQGPITSMRTSDRLLDANAKLAGPLFRLAGGDATMTLSGEVRGDYNPGTAYVVSGAARDLAPDDSSYQKQHVQSLYDEVRLPLGPGDAPSVLLRGLELQLAGRVDHYQLTVPLDQSSLEYVNENPEFGLPSKVTARHTTFAFTAGTRVKPTEGLLVRASFSTGYLPPTAEQIRPDYFSTFYFDPRRSNEFDFAPIKVAGSPTTPPSKAQSLSAGIIVSPAFARGLRLSVDYTRIRKTREVSPFSMNLSTLLKNSEQYPDRVTRDPLTADDIANGYTGGQVTFIDASNTSRGSSTLQALDLTVSYSRDTQLGRFSIDGHASWTPSFKSRQGNALAEYQLAGYVGGPLRWKGNAGISWAKGRLSVGSNTQIYSSYHVALGGYFGGDAPRSNFYRLLQQGSAKIPAQIYTDIFVGYHLPGSGRRPAINYLLTVNNALDQRAPAYVPTISTDVIGLDTNTTGYSYYGDPRGRRFELSVSVAL